MSVGTCEGMGRVAWGIDCTARMDSWWSMDRIRYPSLPCGYDSYIIPSFTTSTATDERPSERGQLLPFWAWLD